MLPNKEIISELSSLLTGHWLTDLANTSALLMERVPDINWVGFYLLENSHDTTLWLGPFQGKPACTTIGFGKGVCGKAFLEGKTIRVNNVNDFIGHIVCDAKSQSELVVPLIKNNKKIGVLDIDSASLNRFTADDELFFEQIAAALLEKY